MTGAWRAEPDYSHPTANIGTNYANVTAPDGEVIKCGKDNAKAIVAAFDELRELREYLSQAEALRFEMLRAAVDEVERLREPGSAWAIGRSYGEAVMASEVERLQIALHGLVEAVDHHKRYWARVDWGSEHAERVVIDAVARAKAALAEREATPHA